MQARRCRYKTALHSGKQAPAGQGAWHHREVAPTLQSRISSDRHHRRGA